VGRDFRPYYNGYWSNTREYGWLWVSDDPWGDVPYRYGRWVFDPRDGWLWVPGYVWGPSWVVWRSGGGNIGWFPMPPDNYYGNGAYAGSFEAEYGYRDWYGPSFSNDSFLSLWVFVDETHFGDRNYRNFAARTRDHRNIIGRTSDTTNYVTVNNYVVNRSVDVNRLERTTNRRFNPVSARDVLGRDEVIAPVTAGRQIERRERIQRPIPGNFQPSQPFVDPSARNGNGPPQDNNGRDFGRGRGQANDRFMPNPPTGQPTQGAQTPQQPGQGFPGRGNAFGNGNGNGVGNGNGNGPNDRFQQRPPVTPAQENVPPGRDVGRVFRDPSATDPQTTQAPVQNEGQPGRGLGRGNGGNEPRQPIVQAAPVVQPAAAPEAPVQNAAQPGRGLGRGGRVPASQPEAQSDNNNSDSTPPAQPAQRRRVPGLLMPH
jgi:hypothetical protein